jgi:hypothetical protein
VIEAVAFITEQLYQDTHQVYLLTTRGELLNVEGERCCGVLPFVFQQAAQSKRQIPCLDIVSKRVDAPYRSERLEACRRSRPSSARNSP